MLAANTPAFSIDEAVVVDFVREQGGGLANGLLDAEVLDQLHFLAHVAHALNRLVILSDAESFLELVDLLYELIWRVDRNHVHFLRVFRGRHADVVVLALRSLGRLWPERRGSVFDIFVFADYDAPSLDNLIVVVLVRVRFLLLLFDAEFQILELLRRRRPVRERGKNRPRQRVLTDILVRDDFEFRAFRFHFLSLSGKLF